MHGLFFCGPVGIEFPGFCCTGYQAGNTSLTKSTGQIESAFLVNFGDRIK